MLMNKTYFLKKWLSKVGALPVSAVDPRGEVLQLTAFPMRAYSVLPGLEIFFSSAEGRAGAAAHSLWALTPLPEWAPWLHWWHKMPSLGQKTLSSNALIQRIHYELKSCSPSSGSTDHALQFAPFSKASSKVVPQMNHVLKGLPDRL